jgi:hypothetical protein
MPVSRVDVMEISVRDYRNEIGAYALNPEDGRVKATTFSNIHDAQRGARGLGTFVRVGLLFPKPQFFALYTHERRLIFYAEGMVWDLTDGETGLCHRAAVPFLKRVAVYRDKRELHRWLYWYTGLLEDGVMTRDFLLFVTLHSRSEVERNKFVFFWESVAIGRDPASPEVQKEMERLSLNA